MLSKIQGVPKFPITKELDVKNLKIDPETKIVDTYGKMSASKLISIPEVSDRQFLRHISLNPDLPSLRQIQVTPPVITNLPVTNIPSSRLSTLLEPSVASNGRTVFYTGNHFAAKSIDGGQHWTYVDVY